MPSPLVQQMNPVTQEDLNQMLVDCAKHGLTRACEIAILQGANINAQVSMLKQTALIAAASEGHIPTCLMLLKQGADPNIQNWNGNNAVMSTWMNRRLEAGLVLIAYGGIALDGPSLINHFSGSLKVGNVDLAKLTPAMAAIRAGLTDRLQELVTDEKNPVTNDELQSIAKWAKKSGKTEMSALLQSVMARRKIAGIQQLQAPCM